MKVILTLLVFLAFTTPVSAQVTDDIRKAAESGDPKAQYEMGRQLERAKSPAAEIVDWYTKSAEQGHMPAQEVLGMMYSKGMYVSRDFVTAYKWSYLAAGQNGPLGPALLEALKEVMTSEQIEAGKKMAQDWQKK
jgi:TPR repeat protein